MQQQGKVRDGDPRLMALAFVNTLHGYMMMYCLNDDKAWWQAKIDSIKFTIEFFIQGLARKNDNTRENKTQNI